VILLIGVVPPSEKDWPFPDTSEGNLFSYPVLFETGRDPVDIDAADFDLDGIPDLLTVNGDSTSTALTGLLEYSIGTDITLNGSNGGEVWYTGTERVIEWTKGDGVISVDIQVSRDSADNWETVVSDLQGTSFAWIVTEPYSTEAFVRVKDATVSSRVDTSDAIFTITERDYVCGDSDSSGDVDIDDVVYLINYIFYSGSVPDPYESGDPECSGGIDIDDVVYLITYIFSSGSAPCDTDGDGVLDC
jgi:hypothetical protein